MNPAIPVLFSCMAVLAQGAVIVDPTRVAFGLNGGVPKPVGIGRLFGADGPFNLFGNSRAAITLGEGVLRPSGIGPVGFGVGPFVNAIGSRCIGEVCITAPVTNCIGVECASLLADNQVRQVEVQQQLQDQLQLQNAQFVQQQQLLNEQQRLQQERILTQEAALTQQAAEQQAQLEEQRAFVDIAQRLQRAQLLEQMKTAQINLAASKGLSNTIKRSCGAEGCFLTRNSLVDPLIAGVF